MLEFRSNHFQGAVARELLIREAFGLEPHVPLPDEVTVRYQLGGWPAERTIYVEMLELSARRLGVQSDGQLWALFQLYERSPVNAELRPLYFLPANDGVHNLFGDVIAAYGPGIVGRAQVDGNKFVLLDTPRDSAVHIGAAVALEKN